MSRFTLHKQERLKHRKKIDELFKSGKSFALFPFRVYYSETQGSGTEHAAGAVVIAQAAGTTGTEQAAGTQQAAGTAATGQPASTTGVQFGVGVSKRYFKKAVSRNRIKRLIREAYRLQKEELYAYSRQAGSHLAVFFIYTGKEIPGPEACHLAVQQCLAKLIRQLNRKK